MAAARIASVTMAPLLMLLVLPPSGQGRREASTGEVGEGGGGGGGGGTRWASPALEALDERHDAEIFQAVVDSMAEWQRRRDHKHREKRAADSVVCYEDVGCFRDSGPFSYLDMLPSPPEQVSTHFLFYSRRSGPHRAFPLPFANITSASAPPPQTRPTAAPRRPARDSPPSISTSLSASPGDAAFVASTSFGPADWLDAGLNASAPTKVIVHGFGSSCGNVWVFEMRSALMSVEDCNVICVDWEAGATIPNYVRAAANTRLVGKQLAMLLARLRDDLGLDLRTVHLIGFSLGAHVAGFAGAELHDLSRITGLDPAGPLFENQDPAARLDAGDAGFVDVIHSNGENLILGGLGSWQPMGHVDFYPNGGRMQKGCSNLFVGAVSDIFWSSREAHGRSLCNHRRAYKFFTDSVSPRCPFPAVPCRSYDEFLEGHCFPCASQQLCGNMGYYADKSTGRGTLYLITRDEEPFCAHQFLIKLESTPSALPVVSYGKIQITLLGVPPGANETFAMTRKDDEELKAGGSLLRLVVPHPSMGEEGPSRVELLYTAYSGWISSGLAKWSVDKVTVGDSFGKSSSFCKRGLILESGVPVTLPLYPGDCNPPSEPVTAAPAAPSALATPAGPASALELVPAEGGGDQEWSNDKKESEGEKPTETSQSASEASASSGADTTARAPSADAYSVDEGLDASKGGQHASESTGDELTTNGNDGTGGQQQQQRWPQRVPDRGAPTPHPLHPGRDDPLLSGGGGEDYDPWQPFTDGPSNSLLGGAEGGNSRREDGARAFIGGTPLGGPGAGPGNGSTTSTSTAALVPRPREWSPRHIPIHGSGSEPRASWLPEMMAHPPELDPPPIHAPLTWHHHWVGEEEARGADLLTSAPATPSTSTTGTTAAPPPHPTGDDAQSSSTPPLGAATNNSSSEWTLAPVIETVQLLPQRLVAFLARAEEYARVTLSGMVLGVVAPSEGNSTTGGDEGGEGRGGGSRRPKQYPPVDEEEGAEEEREEDAAGADARRRRMTAVVVDAPSKVTSVGAMGRGLSEYYSRAAVVGRGGSGGSGSDGRRRSGAVDGGGGEEGGGGGRERRREDGRREMPHHRPRYIPLRRPLPEASRRAPPPPGVSARAPAFLTPRRRRRR